MRGVAAGPSGIEPGSTVALTRHFNNGLFKEVARGEYVRGNTGMAVIREPEGNERTWLLADGPAFSNTLVVISPPRPQETPTP